MEKISAEVYRSRIDAASVLSGTIVTLASMFFLMSLAAAMGLWTYPDMPGSATPEPKFWNVVSFAWGFSVLVGSFWTAIASRSSSLLSGVLNTVTAWAGSYLLFGGISLSIMQSNFSSVLGSSPNGLFWRGFIGDALSLTAGVVGGLLGIWFERHLQRKQRG